MFKNLKVIPAISLTFIFTTIIWVGIYFLILPQRQEVIREKEVIKEKQIPVPGDTLPTVRLLYPNQNIFYIGVNNWISIKVPGIPDNKLSIKIAGGGATIARGNNAGDYIVGVTKVTSVGNKCRLYVRDCRSETIHTIDSFEFRVKHIPDPEIYIGFTRRGKITKELLLATPLIPRLGGFDFDLSPLIRSFSLSMVIDGRLITKSASGNQLSDDMKEMIKKTVKGQKIYFEDFKVWMPDGTERYPGALNLTIE